MKLDLYQIFYESYQAQYLDPKCIWYYNELLTPMFENDVVLDLYRSGKYKNGTHFGVTSWRMNEKTGLTHDSIQSYISSHNFDCYIYGNYSPAMGIMAQGRTFIHEVLDVLYDSGIIPVTNPPYGWVTCFCNYWITTPEIFELYIDDFFMPLHLFMQKNSYIRKILNEGFFIHRGNTYPRHTFVYEYFFGMFLFYNKQLRYTYIPNTIDNLGLASAEVFVGAARNVKNI